MESPPDRRITLAVARLDPWLEGFAERQGPWTQVHDPGGWWVRGGGAAARFARPAWLGPVQDPPDLRDLAGACLALGYAVLVVRRAGYLVAIVEGGQVVASRVSQRHIHGRTAAGGWSQKRYARRRENQAEEISTAAAAALVALWERRPLDLLVLGGDRELREQARGALPAGLSQLPRLDHPTSGTPTRADLGGLHDRVTALRVDIWDRS